MDLLDKVLRLFRREFSFSSLKCFHEYPHVFAVADLYKNGNFYTEYICFKCNEDFLRYLSESNLTCSFAEKIKREGKVEYGDVEELRKHREEELKRNPLKNY
jgi:hypothetical protein